MNLSYLPSIENDANTSHMLWPGSRSGKFSGGKVHLQDSSSFLGNRSQGRRTYEPRYGAYVPPRSSVKTYPQFQTIQKSQGIKTIKFAPLDVKPRPERLHLNDNRQQKTSFDLSVGIKTYETANRDSTNQFYVEDLMQRKLRTRKLEAKKYFDGVLRQTAQQHHEQFGASINRIVSLRHQKVSSNHNTSLPEIEVMLSRREPAGSPSRKL